MTRIERNLVGRNKARRSEAEEDYLLLVSVDGCVTSVCDDVSVVISGLQGAVSLIQNIISGRFKVISSL